MISPAASIIAVAVAIAARGEGVAVSSACSTTVPTSKAAAREDVVCRSMCHTLGGRAIVPALSSGAAKEWIVAASVAAACAPTALSTATAARFGHVRDCLVGRGSWACALRSFSRQ
jgi:hypothetical protein